MPYPRQLYRLFIIYLTMVRHGLDQTLKGSRLYWLLKPFLLITPLYWTRTLPTSRGETLRKTLEDLGPIFIKFGQILSTRRDLLPDDISDELALLQDQVRPMSNAQAREIIEKAYQKPVAELFKSFNAEPLAAASIAQVHVAELDNGREVVIKVLRPGIEKTINQDIAILETLAYLLQKYSDDGRRLRPIEVVREFKRTLKEELDLYQEASNATLLRRNFEDSDQMYIPEIEWDYCRRNVLIMERVHGIPVSNIKRLKELNVNMRRLAEIGVEIFFTQVFRDNFFHADMHPGNIFVDVSNPSYPSYIAVDFGIMGTLNVKDQHYLAENFLAFFNRDYRRVAEMHVHSGWVPSGTRVEEFEGAIRSVCEPIFNRPLKEISFGLLLLRLFQTSRRFNMEIQPQLVLLQKTLLNIEGLGRQLYPDLDLWQTAKPFLERWMDERMGIQAFVKSLKNEAPHWAEKLPQLPNLLHQALEETQHNRETQHALYTEIKALREDLSQHQHQQRYTVVGSALLISGSVIIALNALYVIDLSSLGLLFSALGITLFIVFSSGKKS